MFQRVSLTQLRIDRLPKPIKDQGFLWDSKIVGFGVRTTKCGSKSYVLQTRLLGKVIRLTIGSVHVWTLGQAKIEARRLLFLIDQGIDPRFENEKRRLLIERKQVSCEPALIAWISYLKINKEKWGARYYLDHLDLSRDGGELVTRGLRKNMPPIKEQGFLRPILNLPINQISNDLVCKWANSESAKRPAKTKLSLAMFKAFIGWLKTNPNYKNLVQEDLLPIAFLIHHKKQPRRDCLQVEQLEIWFSSVKNISNKIISAYLQSLLITGARRGELAELKWEYIDTNWKTITIRDKINSTRTIPLTPYVESLLNELPKTNEFVFSSKSREGFIKEPRIAHNVSIQKAGLPHLTIHGLRRSFGTLAEWVDCPVGISAQIMGHAPSALAEKHYRQRPIDLLRKWHIEIETFILEKAKINLPKLPI
jgi:integrase